MSTCTNNLSEQKFRLDLGQSAADMRSRVVNGLRRAWYFGLTVEPASLIAALMTNAATILIARRRRSNAVRADACV
jgi:hypothetical protein